MKKMLDDRLQQDMSEAYSGQWLSSIVLARKKDGTLRFCVDFRSLKLKWTQEIMRRQHSVYLLKLTSSGYAIWASNAPSTFQKLMAMVLAGL